MNKKNILIVTGIFIAIAIFGMAGVLISNIKRNKDNNISANQENNTGIQEEINNSANNDNNEEDASFASTEITIDSKAVTFTSDKGGEYTLDVNQTENGIYLDLHREDTDAIGYYITGLPYGKIYSNREIVNPEDAKTGDFFLPYLFMNEGINFGSSNKDSYAIYFEPDAYEESYDFSVRVVRIYDGLLLDVIELHIDGKNAPFDVYLANADVKFQGIMTDKNRGYLIDDAIEFAKERFPNATGGDWEGWARSEVIVDFVAWPYHADVIEMHSNRIYTMTHKWGGTYGHVYAVSFPLSVYGYMTVYGAETKFVYGNNEVADKTVREDEIPFCFAYSPVCTRAAGSIIPYGYELSHLDKLFQGIKQ